MTVIEYREVENRTIREPILQDLKSFFMTVLPIFVSIWSVLLGQDSQWGSYSGEIRNEPPIKPSLPKRKI